ncbi:MAG: hypothetical protein ABSB15_12380 [Bryobacteraceae bacterium]|jgi:hypothetical protein
MMAKRYLRRAQAAIAIVLLMAALAVCTLASYYSLVKREPGTPAGIVMDESRFTGIRAILPPRGTIGYLSDTGGIVQNPRGYYLTQYFLAPVVVAADAGHQLVVANFASRAAIAPFAAANGLTVERDFSNGVALLRRRP